jgi:glycosyltransferase involved in cell wall biosynthesis
MNHFTIVGVGYNSKPWIRKCLDSVVNQNYKNYDIIMVDAFTNDGTYDVLKEYEQNHQNFTCIRKTNRCFQVENTRDGVHKAKSNSIIVTVDFDDWLPHENVLSKLNEVYTDDVWMTYGTYAEYVGNDQYRVFPDGFFHQHTEETIATGDYRSARWLSSHLRTFRKELYMNIRDEDMIDPKTNDYYDLAGDFVFMLPMLEMAAERQRYISDVMYIYNKTNQLSEFTHCHRDGTSGNAAASIAEVVANKLREKERYSRLETLSMVGLNPDEKRRSQ